MPSKPKPSPSTYWEKEEATRPKMDWKNAPDSAVVAAKKRAAAAAANAKNKKQIKSDMRKGLVPRPLTK